MPAPPGGDSRDELRQTVLRFVLIYAIVALVFLGTTEILFEVSDGENREQSFAVRLGFVGFTAAALAPMLWRELRQRRRAEVRLDEQTASVAAERDRRMEMGDRVGQRLSAVYDDREAALSLVAEALAPEFYDLVHVGVVDDQPDLAELAAAGPGLLTDVRRTPSVTQRLRARGNEIRTAAVVPVYANDAVVAAVLAANTMGRQHVDENDVEALERVGARLGTTLERIDLYLEVQRSERRLNAVVEGSPLGILEVDVVARRISRANAAAAASLHRSEQGLEDAAISDPGLTVLHEVLDRALAGQVVLGEEVPFENDGTPTSWLQLSAAPVFDGDAVESVVVLVADTTGRRQLEQRVQQTQRLESLGRLAGGVAHDFNNLLTVILGYTDMVRRRLPADDANREDLEAVLRSAEHARSITDQLLTVSKSKVVRAERVDVSEALRSIGNVLRRLVGERVDLVLSTNDVEPVMIDRSQLEQVLLNLVVNARDAMPDGGDLTVVARRGQMPDGARATVIEVSDSGEGMDEGTLAHCFEPFFTTKRVQEGTGLGLSTVYGIVAQADGEVTVDSAPGRGTTFAVHLPEARASASALSPERRADAARVLLVDDDASVRGLARRGLEEHGFAVADFGSGQEVLAWLEDGGDVDLLITDVVMPGIRGPEVARLVHEARPHLPVLFISGYAPDAEMHAGQVDEHLHFLPKPFDQEQLLAAVEQTLADHRTRPSAGRPRVRARTGSRRLAP